MFRPPAKLAAIISAAMLAGVKCIAVEFYSLGNSLELDHQRKTVASPAAISTHTTGFVCVGCKDSPKRRSAPGFLPPDRPLHLDILLQNEAVRHPRNVVRDHPRLPLSLYLLKVPLRQLLRIVHPELEQR